MNIDGTVQSRMSADKYVWNSRDDNNNEPPKVMCILMSAVFYSELFVSVLYLLSQSYKVEEKHYTQIVLCAAAAVTPVVLSHCVFSIRSGFVALFRRWEADHESQASSRQTHH